MWKKFFIFNPMCKVVTLQKIISGFWDCLTICKNCLIFNHMCKGVGCGHKSECASSSAVYFIFDILQHSRWFWLVPCSFTFDLAEYPWFHWHSHTLQRLPASLLPPLLTFGRFCVGMLVSWPTFLQGKAVYFKIIQTHVFSFWIQTISKILQPIAVCNFFQQTRMGPKSQEVVSYSLPLQSLKTQE